MNKDNKREMTKKNYLANGNKNQDQWAKNKLNTIVEEPGMNESGREAKKRGF